MPTDAFSPRPISIWRPITAADGEISFVRPAPGPWGDHFSDRLVIPQRRQAGLRVCLFGESVATGYLLAPHWTPAKALARFLGDEAEVVDLARTNERLDSLVDTIQAARQLAPDLLIVLAGNNWNLLETPHWSPLFPSAEARRRVAETLARGGLLAPVEEATRELALQVERLWRCLAGSRTRTIIVVPEINLADWRNRQPVPWLPGGATWRWHRLAAAAEWLLARGSSESALEAAREMLVLDGGCCPTGLDLYGRAARALGDEEKAAVAFRGAVATANYPLLTTLAAPQARPVDQALLTEGAKRNGFEVVSLPDVFAGATEALPGRQLFYDYCHLTPAGIDLAMRAVARQVVGAAPESTTGDLRPSLLARAAIGAAVHGVHRGATGETVRYWLREACRIDESARLAMESLLGARAAAVPAVLTPQQLENHGLTPQHGWRWDGLDAETLAAIGDVLGPAVLERDLTQPRIELWSRLDHLFPEAMEARDVPASPVLRALWPQTSYALIAPGGATVEIVARPAAGGAHVLLDGRRQAMLESGPEWRAARTRVPSGKALRRLSICWSMPERPGEEGLAEVERRLGRGLQAPLVPVFGEVFEIKVG